jgi:uncharacterized protein (DUF433 family)
LALNDRCWNLPCFAFAILKRKGVLEMFERISVNSEVCGGKPCVKGTRIPVYMVLELIEAEVCFGKIIEDYYPNLKKEDIKACVEYAKVLIRDEEIHFATELKE